MSGGGGFPAYPPDNPGFNGSITPGVLLAKPVVGLATFPIPDIAPPLGTGDKAPVTPGFIVVIPLVSCCAAVFPNAAGFAIIPTFPPIAPGANLVKGLNKLAFIVAVVAPGTVAAAAGLKAPCKLPPPKPLRPPIAAPPKMSPPDNAAIPPPAKAPAAIELAVDPHPVAPAKAGPPKYPAAIGAIEPNTFPKDILKIPIYIICIIPRNVLRINRFMQGYPQVLVQIHLKLKK